MFWCRIVSVFVFFLFRRFVLLKKISLLFEVFLSLLIYNKHAFKILTNGKTLNKAGAAAGAAKREKESVDWKIRQMQFVK